MMDDQRDGIGPILLLFWAVLLLLGTMGFLVGCAEDEGQPDTDKAAAIVAAQIAFHESEEAEGSDVQTTCKECKGTKRVRSGDGLAWVPCSCGENCQCEKTGQAATVPQNRMLFFTASWCGPCQIWKQQEKPRLEAVGWTINGSESADFQVIDYDMNTAKAQAYGVTSLPTFVMVRPDGTEIVRYGYIDANQAADIWNENQPEGE